MSTHSKKNHHSAPPRKSKRHPAIYAVILVVILVVAYFSFTRKDPSVIPQQSVKPASDQPRVQLKEKWLQRAYDVGELYHRVYTPCWEGAYGALGEAYLFAATGDSSLLRFHLIDHDLRRMCVGNWVDDRAWVCLAELAWWNVTGKTQQQLIDDAKLRYIEARTEGRLSHHEGFWSWYNWPLNSAHNDRIFTNSNMNQMANVACGLYEATGEKQFLDDALLVWNGDKQFPGIEKTLYHGNGVWKGKPGLAAFGKQLPWEGTEYCSIGAALYRVTKDPKYKKIVMATAEHILDPKNGWVDPQDFYQIHMDGNGAFVHYLLDAYSVAPKESGDILKKIEKMLEHVWTNHNLTSWVTLHRERDNGIRNGWNPSGGEDGYGVNEVGTVHAQGEAMRAFGIFAYYMNHK